MIGEYTRTLSQPLNAADHLIETKGVSFEHIEQTDRA
jgi:hypothetical protein